MTAKPSSIPKTCNLCAQTYPDEQFTQCLECEEEWCLTCDAVVGTEPCPCCHVDPFAPPEEIVRVGSFCAVRRESYTGGFRIVY